MKELNLIELIVNPNHRTKYLSQLKENKEVEDMEVELLTSQHSRINCILSASREMDIDGINVISRGSFMISPT